VTESSVGFFERNAPDTSEKELTRVLHVDDDACFLQCAKQCLEMQGQFQVETVLSVDKALEKLRKEEYDVVVCDYQMPKRDGLQFLRELRRKGISVPFILFTGKGREEVAVKALNLGVDGYFNKNGRPETVYGELAHGIKQTVEKRRAYARTRALNQTSIELASLSSDAIVREFLVKRLREITGAVAVSFADYDPSNQTLIVRLVEVEPRKQEKFALLLGKRLGDVRCPVSDEDYREIIHSVIGKRQTLTEATYGEIPPSVGAEIQKLLGVDRFIGVAYIIEGVLFGTSLLAMKAGMPDPQTEMIESFAYIAAVSLRRCQAEIAMKKSEEKYRQLVENIHEGIWGIDKDAYITFANPRMAEMLGYSIEEMMGRRLSSFMDEHFVEIAKRFLERRQQGIKEQHSFEFIRKDGKHVCAMLEKSPMTGDGGNYVGALVYVTDMTEHKQIEKRLSESSDLYRTIAENVHDGVTIIEKRKIVYVNDRAREIFGYPRAEIIRRTGVELAGLEEKEFLQRIQADAIQTRKLPGQIEFWVVRKDGTKKRIQNRYSPLSEDGATRVIFTTDITEREKTLEKLETLNQKLHIVGSLTRHDIRNKLSSVVNNAYLIRKTLPNDHKALAYLESIESACEQATRIFDFAAMYEKLGCERLQVMDVGTGIEEAVSLFPNLKGVEVVNECHGLKVMADSLLNQVFYNMVDNSLKHGIKVSQIRIYSEEKEKELKLFYEDDGVGIPAANKPKLFDVGFTTGKGSGYGLPLIKKMMEIYGWTIEEEGKAGMGAKFIMRIPKKKTETEDLRMRTQKDSQRQLKI